VAFEDAPFSRPKDEPEATNHPSQELQGRYLNGALPVPDLLFYMKRDDDIAIVIVRRVLCSEHMAIHVENTEGLK
jgi:hypothetical protein